MVGTTFDSHSLKKSCIQPVSVNAVAEAVSQPAGRYGWVFAPGFLAFDVCASVPSPIGDMYDAWSTPFHQSVDGLPVTYVEWSSNIRPLHVGATALSAFSMLMHACAYACC